MRKNLLLVLVLFTAFCMQVNAEVTPQQVIDPEYVINSGYSEATAEEILIIQNRLEGKPCEPLYEKNHNKFVKFLKNCHAYLDPAQDSEQRYHHDIHQSPSFHDL